MPGGAQAAEPEILLLPQQSPNPSVHTETPETNPPWLLPLGDDFIHAPDTSGGIPELSLCLG